MKKLLSLFVLLVFGFALVACGNTDDKPTNPTDGDASLDGTYPITVWVSDTAGVKELFERQIQKFNEANPGIVIQPTVEAVGEGEAATQMVSSVEDGADIFCFAQDQLARLIEAGALAKLGVETSKTITANNDASAVKAATVNGNIYCYPLTSDNGYFMYYDKSVISEDKLDSLEDLIAACEAANKSFSFQLEGSGWYNASFFFATGCVSEWTTDANGKFIKVNDTFDSDAGLVALKGMQKLLKSKAYVDSSNGADFDAAIPSAVVISGTWDSKVVKKILGDNFGATDLPSFTVDGKSYHLGSFSGNKLLGVKPQPNTQAKKAAVLQKLAIFLTGEECQTERFEQFGWGPSNLKAQESDAVQSDVTLAALAEQSAYARPQLQIHGSWWDISKSYATAAKEATTDEELQAALTSYHTSIDGLINMPVDVAEAFTVIGKFEGHDWNFDAEMEQYPGNSGIWYSVNPIAFAAGDQFQVRQGLAWDVQFGAVDAGTGLSTKDNFVVEEAGKYYVKLEFNKEAKTGVVSLVKVNPARGWTVIGSINGDAWTIDLYMEPNADGIWVTDKSYTMDKGVEFKVRFAKAWDESYGNGSANFVVEEAGTYFIQFDPTTHLITLVPALD